MISWSSSLLWVLKHCGIILLFLFLRGESRGRTFNLVGIWALLVIQCYESLIKSTSLTGHILIFLTPTCSLYKQLFVPQQKLQSVKVSFTWSYTSVVSCIQNLDFFALKTYHQCLEGYTERYRGRNKMRKEVQNSGGNQSLILPIPFEKTCIHYLSVV